MPTNEKPDVIDRALTLLGWSPPGVREFLEAKLRERPGASAEWLAHQARIVAELPRDR